MNDGVAADEPDVSGRRSQAARARATGRAVVATGHAPAGNLLAVLLADRGFEVQVLAPGDDLAAAAAGADLVVADAAHSRASGLGPDAGSALLLLAPSPSLEEAVAAAEAGAADYLAVPFDDTPRLCRTLDRLAAGRRRPVPVAPAEQAAVPV